MINFDYHPEGEGLAGYSDSDYAGCVQTRKSTSGGCIMAGRSLLNSWSKQQKVVALSSGEVETYALVATACDVLGLQACARDLGIEMSGELFTDASAALGIVARTGIGKVRHIRTQALWLQECRQEQRLKFTKIPGSDNPADAGTKHMAEELLGKHLTTMRVVFATGRVKSAPMLASLEKLRKPESQGQSGASGTAAGGTRTSTIPRGKARGRPKRQRRPRPPVPTPAPDGNAGPRERRQPRPLVPTPAPDGRSSREGGGEGGQARNDALARAPSASRCASMRERNMNELSTCMQHSRTPDVPHMYSSRQCHSRLCASKLIECTRGSSYSQPSICIDRMCGEVPY